MNINFSLVTYVQGRLTCWKFLTIIKYLNFLQHLVFQILISKLLNRFLAFFISASKSPPVISLSHLFTNHPQISHKVFNKKLPDFERHCDLLLALVTATVFQLLASPRPHRDYRNPQERDIHHVQTKRIHKKFLSHIYAKNYFKSRKIYATC